MFNLKKFMPALMLLGLSSAASAASLGLTAFSVVPLATNTTLSSVGETSVQYTVTNNASRSIPNISIAPNWSSSGVGLSLTHDTCSGETLASSESCTFDVAISGEHQSSSFTIRPKVCGFNGNICSQSASPVSVSLVQHPLPVRVYEVIFPQGSSTEQLVGINIADTSDVIRATLENPSRDGLLTMSPDGSKVYMIHQNQDGATYSALVFDVTATSLTQTETSYSLSYEGHESGSPGQIAITPDGNTLYLTNTTYYDSGYPVYRIDLTNPDATAAVTGISDDTTGNVVHEPKGIVISPDGETVYVSNGNSPPYDIFSFPNASTTTSLSTIVRETNLLAIRVLLMSSDGSTLYAAGQSSAENDPAAIEQYNIADNVSLENTFVPTPNANGIIISAALSPDNTNIYSIVQGNDFLLYSIDTASMTAPSGETYPYHLVFGTYNFNYLSYSPSGSAVSILNYGDAGHLTALFNPDSPDNVTTVNPAGEGYTMYSNTWGSFIG